MSRLNFWLIWLVGGGPLIFAMLLFFSGYSPVTSNERGELLESTSQLADWQLRDSDGQLWERKGRWQVLLTEDTECQQRCDYWREKLPPLVQALGKDRDRVVWKQVALTAVGEHLASDKVKDVGSAVWLVDPLGNLVLRYSLTLPAEDLLKDLKRLLKVSRIG